MANNCKYTKHNRQISRRIHVVRNVEECNLHKKVWCEVGIQLAYNETKNVRGGKFNPILVHAMVILYN